MTTTTPTNELFGRERELAAIEALLDAPRAGRGSALLVEGGAGVGKSSLLAQAGASARASGLLTLTARGAELERRWGFGVARTLLEPFVERMPPPDREAVLAGAAQAARPVVAPGVDSLLEPADEQGVAYGLTWLVANIAIRRPLLLAVDDLHWADAPTLQWLAHLVRRLDEIPAVLLMAARPTEEPALAALRADASTQWIDLRPLEAPAVAALVRSRLPDADAELCDACAEASAGNPFLVEEMLRAQSSGGMDTEGRLSQPDVARSVLARLGRLDPSALAVAQAVCVLGAEAEPAHVAAVNETTLEETAHASDSLILTGLLRAGRPLAFLHPLIEAAVRTEMLPGRWSQLHLRAARTLHAAGAASDRVCLHLLESDPGGDPWVVERLREAAILARGRGAPREAALLLVRALAEPPPAGIREEVRLEAARAALAAGDAAALDELRAVIDDVEAPPRVRAAAAHELGAAVWYLDPAAAREAFDAGLAVLGEDPADGARDELQGERALLNWAAGAPSDDARAEVEALAHRREDAPVAAHLARGWLEERAPLAREHLRRALAGVAAVRVTTPLIETGVINGLIWAEDYDAALEGADALMDHARTRGLVQAFVSACTLRAAVHLRRGALADAEADLRAATFAGNLFTWSYLTLALVEQGRVADAGDALVHVPVTPEQLQGWPRAVVASARAAATAAGGDRERAVADLFLAGDAVDTSFDAVAATSLLRPWRAVATELLLQAGDTGRARELALEGLAQATRTEAPRAIGSALAAAGLATRDRKLLAEAVSVLEQTPARLELARALCALGSDLRRAGERVAAREPLRRAVELADRCGAVPLAERARDELLASGARPRRVALSGVDSLTPSERRVAQLAADGLSNPEIAQTLFITRKTVEKHVAEIFRKLDLRGRGEIAAALHEPAG